MNNELYHYGVLGMKWGVRKQRERTGRRRRPKITTQAIKTTARLYGTRQGRATASRNRAALKREADAYVKKNGPMKGSKLAKEQAASKKKTNMFSLDKKRVAEGKSFTMDLLSLAGNSAIGSAAAYKIYENIDPAYGFLANNLLKLYMVGDSAKIGYKLVTGKYK